MSAPAAITAAMTAYLNEMRDVCNDLGIAACTLKHRSRQGRETSNGVTGNVVWRHSVPTQTLPVTSDHLVWAVWEEQRVRGNQADGGDTAAERSFIPRMRGQMAAIATDAVTIIDVADDDWLMAPDGQMYKVENPALSPDASYWMFELVREA